MNQAYQTGLQAGLQSAGDVTTLMNAFIDAYARGIQSEPSADELEKFRAVMEGCVEYLSTRTY